MLSSSESKRSAAHGSFFGSRFIFRRLFFDRFVFLCQVVPEGDVGLSALESVLLTGPGVFIRCFFGSLPRRKADKKNGIGQEGGAEQCTGCGVLP